MKREHSDDDDDERRKRPRRKEQYHDYVSVYKHFSSSVMHDNLQSTFNSPIVNSTTPTAPDNNSDLSLRNTEQVHGGIFSEYVMANAKSVFVNEIEETSPSYTQQMPRASNHIHATKMYIHPTTTSTIVTTPPLTVTTTQKNILSKIPTGNVIEQDLTSPTSTPTSADSTCSTSSTENMTEEEKREHRRKRVLIKNLLN
ncbi:phosphoglycerol transferase [Acrasis kona]|uniref:Phosphoglycerol transferase n=1 Tax=Acrasis kona TaxID=1008807 RepID=A0AAW2ZIB9_9EUKA